MEGKTTAIKISNKLFATVKGKGHPTTGRKDYVNEKF
jgi:hypothetical protein